MSEFNLIFLAGSSPISISLQGVLNRTGRCSSLHGCWVHLRKWRMGIEWEIDALMLSLINVTVVNDHWTFLSSVYNGDDNAHHKRKDHCTFLSHRKRTFLVTYEDSM
jgi:hypothetical protein